MREIPADIRAEAERLIRIVLMGTHDDPTDVICGAILAERERCAKIAETLPCAELVSTSDDNHEMTFGVGAAAQRNAIVSAIRKGDAA